MNTYFVVATAIIVKDGRFLIAQRSQKEEKFPGYWTVPGGTLEPTDYAQSTPNSAGLWYNILERLIEREVREEVGVEIKNIRYLVSLAYQKKAGPALCVSLLADFKSGEVKLSDELQQYAWVTLAQAHSYPLIAGIMEELLMADDVLQNRPVRSWSVYEQKVEKEKKKK